MTKRIKKISKSITSRVLFPIILISLIQSLITTTTLYFVVLRNTINNQLIDNFESSVHLRKNYLENLFSNSWDNIDSAYDEVIAMTSDFMKNSNTDADSILKSETLSQNYLGMVSSLLPSMLHSNNVNDAYIILDSQYANDSTKKELTYIRTKNPSNSGNNEIDVLYAPTNVWKQFYLDGYGLDMNVETNTFADLTNVDFFTKPINQFRNSKDMNAKTDYGYWSCDAKILSAKVLTYSLPLRIDDKVIGVLGIGITESYLKTSLSSLNKGEEINIALARVVNDTICGQFTSYVDYSLPSMNEVKLEVSGYDSISRFTHNEKVEFVYEDSLNIYDKNSPYDEQWEIIGILPKTKIFEASYQSSNLIGIIYLISFAVMVLVYLLISYLITKPILRVSKSLSSENVNDIPKTNVTEVDNLIEQIELYSSKADSLSNQLKRLIEDSSYDISFFEYSKKNGEIHSTKHFFNMLNLDCMEEIITVERFMSMLESIKGYRISTSYDDPEHDILLKTGDITYNINDKYLQIKVVLTDDGVFATLTDQTSEYQEKERIVHERDYDVLTGLLNRRGFISKIDPLFKKEHNGSLFMIDVDNLKYLNDQYGHDLGDAYLRKIGEFLIMLSMKYPSLYTCHVSGDEFILYLHGYSSIDEETRFINDLKNIRNEYISYRSKNIYISLSIGVRRREPSLTYDTTLKQADYAMYVAKSSGKNKVQFFDEKIKNEYSNESIMHDELNRIINEKLIDYAYQPIVDIHTGEIFGYEALMRPKIQGISPLKVLNAAKKYNRLYDIEKLTMFMASEKFFNSGCDRMLFINSISSQILADDDATEFDKLIHDHYDQIEIELIEEDMGQNEVISKKVRYLESHDISYAIDDYGTGYNNIGMILSLTPHCVKIEGSLIQGIDKDEHRKRLAKSIISYCKVNNIKIVAEAVETVEELAVVKHLGVDYVQGHLLAKPDFEIKDIPPEKKDLLKNI